MSFIITAVLVYICYIILYFFKTVEAKLNIVYSVENTIGFASSGNSQIAVETTDPNKRSNYEFADPSANSSSHRKSQWLTIAMAAIV